MNEAERNHALIYGSIISQHHTNEEHENVNEENCDSTQQNDDTVEINNEVNTNKDGAGLLNSTNRQEKNSGLANHLQTKPTTVEKDESTQNAFYQGNNDQSNIINEIQPTDIRGSDTLSSSPKMSHILPISNGEALSDEHTNSSHVVVPVLKENTVSSSSDQLESQWKENQASQTSSDNNHLVQLNEETLMTSTILENEVHSPSIASESVRDLDKLLKTMSTKDSTNDMRRSSSQPQITNLLYPNLTPSSFAVPGGFRRQFVGDHTMNNHTTKMSWLRALYDRSLLYIDDDDFSESSAQQPDRVLASTGKTTLTIFKSFVATGVLFLPAGYKSSGLIAGLSTMLLVGLLSLYGMQLLLKARVFFETGGALFRPVNQRTPLLAGNLPNGEKPTLTFATLCGAALGPIGARLANLSIIFSQLGFCCVYFGFIARVLDMCRDRMDIDGPAHWVYMVGSLPIIIPVCLIRHLKYFVFPNLLADVFVVSSMVYIIIAAIVHASTNELEPWSCEERNSCFWIRSETFLMFFGTSVYTFEGVAMIIPIQNSMKQPEDLPKLLNYAMFAITTLFCAFGFINFYVYRSKTGDIILENLPDAGLYAVTGMFIVVAMFMFPLMLFPATRIIENRFFKVERRSGKKWGKNMTRVGLVLACLLVSSVGEKSINSMVALIGGLFCVPLALIYPPLVFLRLGSGQLKPVEKILATMLLVFGVSCMCLSTYSAISQWNSD